MSSRYNGHICPFSLIWTAVVGDLPIPIYCTWMVVFGMPPKELG